MKDLLCTMIAGEMPGVGSQEILPLLEVPPEKEMGDLALPCFGFAKILRKNPKMIAEELAAKIETRKAELEIENVYAVNGYLNQSIKPL